MFTMFYMILNNILEVLNPAVEYLQGRMRVGVLQVVLVLVLVQGAQAEQTGKQIIGNIFVKI